MSLVLQAGLRELSRHESDRPRLTTLRAEVLFHPLESMFEQESALVN